MSLGVKLKDYFKENGLQMKWFAEKMKMPKQQLYQVIAGYAPLPEKYWQPMIILTKGKIGLSDILSYNLEKFETIEFKSCGLPDRCEVSLKIINTVT